MCLPAGAFAQSVGETSSTALLGVQPALGAGGARLGVRVVRRRRPGGDIAQTWHVTRRTLTAHRQMGQPSWWWLESRDFVD